MQETDVVIIGAGMAGVSAANTLRDSGLTTIVLEGSPGRIGGRILSSDKWKGATIDLGASWITHELVNPLTDIAIVNGIDITQSELLYFSLRTADGRKLSEKEIAGLFALYLDVYGEVKLNAEGYREQGKADICASEEFARVLKRRKLSRDVQNGVKFLLNFAIEEPNASGLEDLSLYHWDDDYVFLQLALGVFPKGYRQLVDVLAEGIDIRKDHVVSGVAYTEKDVTVSTNHGDFHAAQAIIAVPHAVLHNRDIAFSPDLPAWKTQAIDNIHPGLSDKFYFRFPSVFWDEEPHLVNRIDDTGEGKWSTWVNYYKYTNQPIIFAFNRNEHAKKLEQMTDEQVVAEAMPILRRAYPSCRVPEPEDIQRSFWGSGQFSKGTLAHVPPGSSGADYTNIGKPWRTLRFAGDATVPQYAGLVMAAYLSGVREGHRVRRNAGVLKPVRR
jgi:Monoamine oxidase